jgi:hypothetical protein
MKLSITAVNIMKLSITTINYTQYNKIRDALLIKRTFYGSWHCITALGVMKISITL